MIDDGKRSKPFSKELLINAIVTNGLLGANPDTIVAKIAQEYKQSLGSISNALWDLIDAGKLTTHNGHVYCPQHKVKCGIFHAIDNKYSGFVDFDDRKSVYIKDCCSALDGDIVNTMILDNDIFDDDLDDSDKPKQGIILKIVKHVNEVVPGKVVVDENGNFAFKPDNHKLDKNIVLSGNNLHEYVGQNVEVDFKYSSHAFADHGTILALIHQEENAIEK